MSQLPDWPTIDRYLAGEASPAEREAVDAWVAAQPDRAAALAWLRQQPTAGEPKWDADAAWKRFAERPRELPKKSFVASASLLRWAAVVVVAVGLGLFLTQRNRERAPAEFREVFTLNGQRTTITLGDGTRVSLNGASRLRYDDDFGKSHRDVYLDGEAYFDVKHDDRRPFRVHARHALAEDVGTRFTVRAYADRPAVDVAVDEGIVALSRDSSSSAAVRITAGELGVLPDSGAPSVSRLASLDRYVGWAGGMLVLDGIPLREAASEIERWFGVKVAISDSALAKRTVSARFRGESVTQVLDALGLALGARVTRTDTGFVLSPESK